MQGTVNIYFPGKGYGFINEVRDGKIIRYFFHVSQIISGTPKIGAPVKFDFISTLKGLQAINVTIDDQFDIRAGADALKEAV